MSPRSGSPTAWMGPMNVDAGGRRASVLPLLVIKPSVAPGRAIGVAGDLTGRVARPVRLDIDLPGAARRTAEPAPHFGERRRRAVAVKHRGDRQDGIVMASLARGDQFAGVGRQIGKGRRSGHGYRPIRRRHQGRRAFSKAVRSLSTSRRRSSSAAAKSACARVRSTATSRRSSRSSSRSRSECRRS
jgi:hypothetical protein